jgi:sterol desaturase/sphingolipid hydroxylase (fatty acid hydroxylase superfamily)
MIVHLFGPYRVWVILFLGLLILLEGIWSWREHKQAFNVRESLSNTVIMVGYILSKILTVSYQLAVLGFIGRFAFYHFPETVGVFALTFVATDFLYYWYHRISHQVKFFWAFHLVHHSSPWMNLTTAYRINWFSALLTPYFFIPAALIGLPPEYIAVSFGLNLFYQFFMHTEAVGKIPLVEGVVDTPSAHRVHHGSNPIYIDKNFGGVLMVWDRIFGTYQPETEPVKYGTTAGFLGHNPFKLVFKGFADLVKGTMDYKG